MSNFFSSLYILKISISSDVGLVKIFSDSVCCPFILLTVSLAFRSFSVSGGPVYFLLLSVSVLPGLYLGSSLLCPCIETTSHFLFYQVQCGQVYIEVFNPLGLEFCEWWWIWIYIHSSTCWHPVMLTPFVEGAFYYIL